MYIYIHTLNYTHIHCIYIYYNMMAPSGLEKGRCTQYDHFSHNVNVCWIGDGLFWIYFKLQRHSRGGSRQVTVLEGTSINVCCLRTLTAQNGLIWSAWLAHIDYEWLWPVLPRLPTIFMWFAVSNMFCFHPNKYVMKANDCHISQAISLISLASLIMEIPSWTFQPWMLYVDIYHLCCYPHVSTYPRSAKQWFSP